MKLLVIFLFVVSLVSCNGETKLQDYRLTTTCATPAVQDCTSGGLFCDSCSSLVLCQKTTSDQWEKTKVATCSSPLNCVSGKCTTDSDPFCDGTACLDFPCQDVGVFPDPFFCNKFVMCVDTKTKLQAYVEECEDGYGYDAATGLCSKELTNDECSAAPDYPVPLCQSAGDTGPLTGNPSIYYVCEEYSNLNKVLYPVLFLCPHGQIYKDYECINKT